MTDHPRDSFHLKDAAIIIYVDAEKIKALTHRQRVDLMGRLDLFLDKELPAVVKDDVVHYWDTQGFDLPGAMFP